MRVAILLLVTVVTASAHPFPEKRLLLDTVVNVFNCASDALQAVLNTAENAFNVLISPLGVSVNFHEAIDFLTPHLTRTSTQEECLAMCYTSLDIGEACAPACEGALASFCHIL